MVSGDVARRPYPLGGGEGGPVFAVCLGALDSGRVGILARHLGPGGIRELLAARRILGRLGNNARFLFF